MNKMKINSPKFSYFQALSLGVISAIAIDCLPAMSIEQSGNIEGFILPSRNIYCLYFPDGNNTTLRCDLRSGLIPRPKAACDLDYTGISLGKKGRARPTCAGDTAFGNYPVLNYGRTWTRQGIKCTASTNGLTCRNSRNHGFFLSKQKWSAY
jgi:hypothetical protein